MGWSRLRGGSIDINHELKGPAIILEVIMIAVDVIKTTVLCTVTIIRIGEKVVEAMPPLGEDLKREKIYFE